MASGSGTTPPRNALCPDCTDGTGLCHPPTSTWQLQSQTINKDAKKFINFTDSKLHVITVKQCSKSASSIVPQHVIQQSTIPATSSPFHHHYGNRMKQTYADWSCHGKMDPDSEWISHSLFCRLPGPCDYRAHASLQLVWCWVWSGR